jgi:hypothetical protein
MIVDSLRLLKHPLRLLVNYELLPVYESHILLKTIEFLVKK